MHAIIFEGPPGPSPQCLADLHLLSRDPAGTAGPRRAGARRRLGLQGARPSYSNTMTFVYWICGADLFDDKEFAIDGATQAMRKLCKATELSFTPRSR